VGCAKKEKAFGRYRHYVAFFSNECHFYKDLAAMQLLFVQRSCDIFVE